MGYLDGTRVDRARNIERDVRLAGDGGEIGR